MKSFVVFQNEFNVFMSNIQVTAIVNEILQSCTYILSKNEESKVYLVDCGDTVPIFSFLSKNNKTLDGVILTHAHYDHVYGLNDLLKLNPNLKVFAGIKTFEGIMNEDDNMSYLYTDEDFLLDLNEEQKICVDDSVLLTIWNERLEIIPTPGHAPDCITYIVGRNIFTGDSYNPNSPVFTKWRNSNIEEALENEMKINAIIKSRGLTVFPGHLID